MLKYLFFHLNHSFRCSRNAHFHLNAFIFSNYILCYPSDKAISISEKNAYVSLIIFFKSCKYFLYKNKCVINDVY